MGTETPVQSGMTEPPTRGKKTLILDVNIEFQNASEATVDGQLPFKETIRVGSTLTRRTNLGII